MSAVMFVLVGIFVRYYNFKGLSHSFLIFFYSHIFSYAPSNYGPSVLARLSVQVPILKAKT